jgi:DNA-directed RNA polymerase specialized sigma24 family protein
VEPEPDTQSETGCSAAVEQLLAARGPHLMRAAIALAGSRPDGEDLLQAGRQLRLLRRDHVAAADQFTPGPARAARPARILELPAR